MKNNITAIILAGGQGKRMNTEKAKQFLEINNKPILYYTIDAFEKSIVNHIIIVASKQYIEYCREDIVKKYNFNKVDSIVEGGKERYNSVYNGLMAVKNTDFVLIHDGARPLVEVEDINKVVDYVTLKGACILAVPVKDTIKMVDEDKVIVSTPRREMLWSAQTPQAFKFDLILAAYKKMQESTDDLSHITDDASVYESYLNKKVSIVEGNYKNIKITTPEDLLMLKEL